MERSPPQQGLGSPTEQSEEKTDQETENRDSNDKHCENFLLHDRVENGSSLFKKVRDERSDKSENGSNGSSDSGSWRETPPFPEI